jgi:hypothetical protein
MPVAGVKTIRSDEACVPDERGAEHAAELQTSGRLANDLQTTCNEAVSGTLPPMTKAPSTALPARSNGLDNIDGSPERGVYT